MANRFDGRWQVYGPGGTSYPDLFRPLAEVASTELTPGHDSFRIRYADGSSIVYGGTGLGYDGTTLSGIVASVTIRDAADQMLAQLTGTAANPFRIDTGVAVHSGAALHDLLLSGDNLVVGSGNGVAFGHEVLRGGGGNDTYQPGNGHTTIVDGIGTSTLDVSALAGPVTVDLLSQTFTVAGAAGAMGGVTRVTGTALGDTILGGADASFVIATGAGDDGIQAYGETPFGGRFTVDAGSGDDTITIDQRGYGTIDGGDGHDTLQAGGDIRFYGWSNVETLANTYFLRVRTEQLRTLEQITNLNPFNSGQVVVELTTDGTVDFGRLMAPGLTVAAQVFVPGTNVNGTAGGDLLFDFSSSLVDGFRTPATFFGGGGDDTFHNNSGLAVLEFSGTMADYTITGTPFISNFVITDNRPGSPDGTDTLIGANAGLPMLRFADHFASINEQIAHKADPSLLPAQIYNGVLQLFGPDNFDYQGMFPRLDRALAETLAADGSSYTVDYANFTRIVFAGAGLATSGAFTPSGGSVSEILVYDTTAAGTPALLARFYSEPVSNHLLKVPFDAALLAGGARVYQMLMSGNNHVDGSPNDEFLVADLGRNTIAAGPGFDTLHLGRNVDSFVAVTDADGNIERVDYIDGASSYEEFDPFDDPIPGSHPAPAVLNAITSYFDSIGPNGELPPLPSFIAGLINALIGGDPHVTTLDGVGYSFHALGEFIVSKSTVAGDDFELQVRTIPYVGRATVVGQAATRAGIDRVTFDAARDGDDIVRINGLAADFSSGPVVLDGGVLTKLALNQWRLAHDTGEVMDVSEVRTGVDYLSVTLDPGSARAPGTLAGIWGNFDGDRDNEFRLADGTVLARPLSRETLYGAFADAWRVTDANSLLDYGAGEATGTFTSRAVPPAFSIADLPADVVARAEALVNTAGIANGAMRDFAIFDYLLTGDPAAVTAIAALASAGVVTVEREAPAAPPAETLLGIIAVDATVVEAAAGQPTPVAFQVYRTGPAIGDVVVDWQAVAPGAGFFVAGDFPGGVLPSGSVTIPSGSASVLLNVPIPDGAATLAREALRVEIASPGGLSVVGLGAQVEVVNNGPAQGIAAQAEFRLLSGNGTLSQSGDDWVLDLGSIAQGAALPALQLAVANVAPAGGNALSGSFTAAGDLAAVAGAGAFLRLATGGLKGGISAAIDTNVAGLRETVLTLRATESNATGYSAAMGDETLTIRASIVGAGTPPTAEPDAYTLARGRTVTIDAASGLGGNDSGDAPLVFTLRVPPAQGSVVVDADGSFTVAAGPGFVGADSFTYRVTQAGGLFDEAGVTLVFEERAETLLGSAQNEAISGYGLDDLLLGLAGDDALDGGDGDDIAFYGGSRADSTITAAGGGAVTVAGADGTDTLVDIEQL